MGREMCIVEGDGWRVVVGRWFWCLKAGEGHRAMWSDDRACCAR